MEDLLEEIVGNIYDEFDPAEDAPIERLDEGLWRVAGSAPIEDVERELGVRLPADRDYDTLGGLVFSCLRAIPPEGAQLDVETAGLHIHVDRVEDRRIASATVRKLPPQDAAGGREQ